MPEKITLTIVVNGQPTELTAAQSASVESLIPKALEQTGNVGQPPDNWELRDAAGRLLTSRDKAAAFSGQTLFLNLKAGIGGCFDDCSIY